MQRTLPSYDIQLLQSCRQLGFVVSRLAPGVSRIELFRSWGQVPSIGPGVNKIKLLRSGW